MAALWVDLGDTHPLHHEQEPEHFRKEEEIETGSGRGRGNVREEGIGMEGEPETEEEGEIGNQTEEDMIGKHFKEMCTPLYSGLSYQLIR